jgi:DNA-directed RNA polymerase specialized sigma subunit
MNYLQKQYKYKNKLFYIDNYLDEEEKNTFEFILEDKKIDINKYVSKLDFENAINKMTELEMRVIIESCLDNLSIAEIAQKYKIKKANVSFIKECAIKKLTHMLNDYIKRETDENFKAWSVIADKANHNQ